MPRWCCGSTDGNQENTSLGWLKDADEIESKASSRLSEELQTSERCETKVRTALELIRSRWTDQDEVTITNAAAQKR